MLQVLRCMHERGYVHCDVKPDNFCFPRGFNPHSPVPVDTVFVVDMGMARKFTDKRFDWGAADCLYEGTVRPTAFCHLLRDATWLAGFPCRLHVA